MTMEHTSQQQDSGRGADGPRAGEVELLIGRLVDGEADEGERQRFEALAGQNPQLWGQLSEQLRAMLDLERQVAPLLEGADRVELPAPGASRVSMRLAWPLAVIGWAAAIALAFALLVRGLRPDPAVAPREVLGQSSATVELSYDEHFRRYMEAPNVLGEFEPLVLEIQELSDGSTAIRYLRRIEEVDIRRPGEEVPVTSNGRLTVDPQELRGSARPRPRSD